MGTGVFAVVVFFLAVMLCINFCCFFGADRGGNFANMLLILLCFVILACNQCAGYEPCGNETAEKKAKATVFSPDSVSKIDAPLKVLHPKKEVPAFTVPSSTREKETREAEFRRRLK
jgi:hypothetical protein